MGTTGLLPGISFPRDSCELSTKHETLLENSCDQDDSNHVDDDVTSTMSESSSGIGGLERLVPSKSIERQTSGRRALHGHESDVDSGIVSCQLMDNHTASISSSETDSSRESTSNEQKSRQLSDSTQCVRFDEQLHLSEENIRRSCRKLFATLYSHRFSYPCYNDSEILSSPCEVRSVHPSKRNTKAAEYGVPRRGRPVPHSRLDMRQISESAADHESQRRIYGLNQPVENDSVCNRFGTSTRRGSDFSVCKNVQKIKPEYRRSVSNTVHSSSLKLFSDATEKSSENTEPTANGMQMNGFKYPDRKPYRTQNATSAKEQSNHRNLVADQRLASSNGFKSPFPPTHNQNSSWNSNSQRSKPLMHKSLSCTVLSTSENLYLSLTPYDKQDPALPRRTSDPISVSSLNISDSYRSCGLVRTSHHIPQVSARSSMVRAYARVVPIVSDDSNSCTSSKLEVKSPKDSVNIPSSALNKNRTSYPVSPVSLSMHSRSTEIKSTTADTSTTGNGVRQRFEITSDRKSSSYKDLNYSKPSEEFKGSIRAQKGRSNTSGRSGIAARDQPSFSEIRSCEYPDHRSPLIEGMQLSNRQNVSPYKSFTLNHLKSNGNRKHCKTEYEALDQSQKNRFNSLPVLDNLVSTDIKDGNFPTNSKRGLHQSDFTLYRNRPSPSSSSSGKSFLDRIQGFTRSAKNAVQRAFSTERIYRPEREERYEAEGQKLKRSRSFIRGLKERMSKKKRRETKKKKMKPPAAHIVTQERLNTSWDEPVLGPGSVTHVEGQLLQLNSDGSQVIELTKPPSKPYGFFVARGRIRNSRGVFVSRMRDQETEEHLTGLLGIGDEILEIQGLNVKHADILEVNSLMSQRNSLILTVLPYVCRKD